MASNADVRSLERLQEFLERSEAFRVQLLKELENLRVELRRLTHWIEGEATSYWEEQVRKSQRHLMECQDALVRCMSYVRESERRPCTEEKKRLRRAEARRALCEQKLKLVRSAATFWEREITKVGAKLQRCSDLGEAEMMVAVHHLRAQIENLAAYASLQSAGIRSLRSGPEKPSGEIVVDEPLQDGQVEQVDGGSDETH